MTGENGYDVIILGSGPAGLQAAIHAARRNVAVMVIGRIHKSSAFSAHLENYCCVSSDLGIELLRQAKTMAQQSGAAFLDEDAVDVFREEGCFHVVSEGGRRLNSTAIILAMGILRERLDVKGENEFRNRGISYCVECDAGFYKGDTVAIIGNGSAAVTGALMLLFYASEVHLICENMDVSGYLIEKVKGSSMHIHEKHKAVEIYGENFVKGLELDDGTRIEVNGVFIELGAKGAMDVAANLGVEMDNASMTFVMTNKKQETNVQGVYAAGDICGLPW
ncbi:MAG: NAD(P)/FAD-dependent oxidoreductase, partial [Deltaproteobacteria bacterium]|nr:NAD(P)/FAD-dependent oxidoreductase [Deltaproteobacteria bacterium]